MNGKKHSLRYVRPHDFELLNPFPKVPPNHPIFIEDSDLKVVVP
jgi:hypothetical protein